MMRDPELSPLASGVYKPSDRASIRNF